MFSVSGLPRLRSTTDPTPISEQALSIVEQGFGSRKAFHHAALSLLGLYEKYNCSGSGSDSAGEGMGEQTCGIAG
jgi:hypothetical protein